MGFLYVWVYKLTHEELPTIAGTTSKLLYTEGQILLYVDQPLSWENFRDKHSHLAHVSKVKARFKKIVGDDVWSNDHVIIHRYKGSRPIPEAEEDEI